MSGLTPILDTLLTQVLGRRADVQTAAFRAAEQAVGEVRPGAPARPVESDSRLDPRVLDPRLAGPRGAEAKDASSRVGQPPAGAAENTPARGAERLAERASVTELSTSARIISRLLQPARGDLPSVIRAPGQLLDPAAGEPRADQLAQRLGQSIRSSGLFYESHLNQWFQGKLPASELAREPQMRLLPAPAAAAREAAPQSSVPGEGGVRVTLESPRGALPASPGTAATSTAPDVAPEGPAKIVANSAREALARLVEFDLELPADSPSRDTRLAPEAQERIQSIVRHQLEMLGTPVLKWEGEVSNGFLMFMEITLPQYDPEDGVERDADGQRQREAAGQWSTNIELELPLLGEVAISLRHSPGALAMDIATAQEDTAELLRREADQVIQRLEAMGFAAPAVRVVVASQEDADGWAK
ncbi:flagellar hook-length control protein FliK [Mangrovimicrobium sediminis]|uniref:Flagellar hook-length control protein FliK n=1 Tax=Mangrovimicrobium sediminis TaxID=2562682 RepID=A0A4Z0M0Z8_9GAMM|nr:flagellar hook-length control protein FliK [Haliea sp. SAOS-164]TGD73160.1 flagellar hook-length control protein FliK [Haliea sp. SAOS-164]